MAKSLSSLWLKSVRRLSKVQKTQQARGRKLIKSLLPKAVRAAPVRRAKPVKTAAPKAVKRSRQVVAKPVPPVPGLPGSWQKSYFSVPGAGQLAPARRLLYWLYQPAGKAPTPRPLVVMLHGCQQTATDFAAATRMNELAERKGFAVLYPQQSVASDSHRCWHWYQRATQQGQGEAGLIAAMIAQVQGKHGLDASRTYVTGLSAGAALATIVALRYPHMIAAVGLHSTPVFGTSDSPMSAFRAMQQGSGRAHSEATAFAEALPQFPGMPAVLIHGERDAVVRRINAEQLTRQFEIINAAFITRDQPVRRSYAARRGGRSPRHGYQTTSYYAGRKPQLLRCQIDALGHAWSGGDERLAFSAREGPDATLLMWTFFALHRRIALVPKP
ncbi:PHB depolymerase family esterase [Polaromonas sp.]|uniref:extracellular catalytic domain type 1 short-chain-length polyhydroxyalkanoate depolymerase n=1 Tax=Polaromonas sp. TaxID=1869339 RepID=UPI0018569B38|nr:PHB depolymerase family esterase [Polaromonas sp.]NMM05000.1 PHB depolymerase family esterase [Polaromonas sp.]